ncbi:MAG TPA: hypothetical protein VHM00_11680 [Caldimonas sp.]|nr:hypothetical protein [Caldimonas sp.]HEX2541729.1 hypothetical protein [Caldimonas sp.]
MATALACTHVLAADARPSRDVSQPATAARVGGGPADARFRDANQRAQDAYRNAVRECKGRPAADRTSCNAAARARLRAAQTQARAERGKAEPAIGRTR